MSVESERAFSAVWTRLRTDTTLTALLPAGAGGFHRGLAPTSSATPYVVVEVLSAIDYPNAVGGARVWQDTLVQTRACGQGLASWSTLVAIQDRIDALLQGYTTTVDGVYIVQFRRESAPPIPPENLNGVIFTQTAQVWRSEAEPV